jgi:amino acid transporter
VAFLFSGIALHALVPAVPAWIFTVLAFAVATAFNHAGVRLAARAGFVVLVAEIAVLGVFVVAGLVVLAASGPVRPLLSPFTGVGVFDFSLVVSAVSIAVLSYLGFDAIASFAEESTGDSRQVGRAIHFCLAVAGALFVLQSWIAAALSPVSPFDLAAHPEQQGANFYDVARVAVGPWLATLVAVTKAIGPAFAAMAGQAAAARLLFGMAREGRLPRALADVDQRRGVPRGALLSAAGLTLIVSVWAARRSDGLSLLVSIVDIGALAAFTLLHASVVGYFAVSRRARSTPLHVIVPLVGSVVTIWVLVEATRVAQLVGLAWLAAGLAIYAAGRGNRPQRNTDSEEIG